MQPLFEKLDFLTNYLTPLIQENHILEQFYKNHEHLTSLPTTIHCELFDYIISHPTPTFEEIQIKFPYLPPTFIYKTLLCRQPINGYIQPPPQPPHPPPSIQNVIYNNNATSIISWNITTLNTSIPCIHKLMHSHQPAILALQNQN